MSDSNLYDDDILLWSEQQAAVIRRLRETARGLPNELDIENVAEEIEGVGRSELATVQSFIRLILLHLIKLAVETDSAAAGHWQSEVTGFHSDLTHHYAASMRQRIGIDELWATARQQARSSADREAVGRLPASCPFDIDDLVVRPIDVAGLVERLQTLSEPRERRDG